MRVGRGAPAPLGATFDGAGVNFALFSAHATAVDLCLFDAPDAATEAVRLPLTARTGDIWHAHVPGLRPGQLYGYRVSGPWDPANGHRFNPAKLLLDPYARVIGRPLTWDRSLVGSTDAPTPHDLPDTADSAPFAPLAAIPGPAVGAAFDWGGDSRPGTPWEDTLIYELHVKGFSALNPAVPPAIRGTYLGVAADASIQHLLDLGVTAVELMPIHLHVDERRLVERGLTNYWGYNTLNFFIPDERFATGRSSHRAADEFRTMVRALHRAGLEVILDVVYNHTGEGDETGPTLTFRGLDNRSYYRLDAHHPGRYDNAAGTGNTLDIDAPPVAALVLDSLRFWVEQMHVDGFRFDLASVLARHADGVDPGRGFCRAVVDDPVLSRVKLIAEPWDATGDGYLVGAFPRGWSEWNDRFRNDVRRFWRGEASTRAALATRIAGSSDLYRRSGRLPTASVNMVTSHDGFTLADLVSYDDRHNNANLEGNADGERHNFSWNSGVEGPTTDPGVIVLRRQHRRNFVVTLLMSLGVPMISGGDEMGRTQQGNNNAYCHDSPLTWTPWQLDADERAFLEFVRSVTAFRRSHASVRRGSFLEGRRGSRADVVWLRPDAAEMNAEDWADAGAHTLGVLFDARGLDDDSGAGGGSHHLLFVVNAATMTVDIVLPGLDGGGQWQVAIDIVDPARAGAVIAAGEGVSMPPHSAVVLTADGANAIQATTGR
jgi:glycogen operon protein